MQCAASYDGDANYSERIRKAAKESFCPECGEKILKGEEYIFSTVFSEGRISNHKMCMSCDSVVRQFFPDGWYFGQIWEDLDSYLDNSWLEDLPSNCISKLHPVAKNKVCDMLQRYQLSEN